MASYRRLSAELEQLEQAIAKVRVIINKTGEQGKATEGLSAYQRRHLQRLLHRRRLLILRQYRIADRLPAGYVIDKINQ